MVKAERKDKDVVVDILTRSFEENKSVNYIIKQDDKRKRRIRSLMDYSFEVCSRFGKVYLSDDKRACALIIIPEKKKTTLKSILLDLKLMIFCIGISGVQKALTRESRIRALQPKKPMYYLWFIGVEPDYQGHGIGSKLLNEIIAEGKAENRTICLETSTMENIPWYGRFGFKIYNQLNLGYDLFFLEKEADK